MYRIVIARSGYYYVQENTGFAWKMVGGFFRTRRGAENLISDYKRHYAPPNPRVVGYY